MAPAFTSPREDRFAELKSGRDIVDLARLVTGIPVLERGSVWLVGAGPGDAGLLTALAIHALQSADVVIYDALVGPPVLALVSACATIEYAGKRGGKRSTKQSEISERLISLARGGRRVVRLKGGDPFVFGRGAEEVMALAAAGIPFRVVPGITAGIGGLAAADIPLTARDTNHAVIFMTGHRADTCSQPMDWRPYVETGAPIVLYMGLMRLGVIMAGLQKAGMPPSMPVAVVTNATRSSQTVIVSTVSGIEGEVERGEVRPPALIVVGSIVGLRDALHLQGLSKALAR